MTDAEPVVIPWQHLSAEALRNLVRSCIEAEVGDSNVSAFDSEAELTRLLEAVRRSEWIPVFDPATETTALRHRDSLPPELLR